MENENVGEQPEEKQSLEPNEQTCQNEGSPFGKFATAQDLKQAYLNLEKEFTRKSQLLKQFEKEKQNDANVSNNSQGENDTTQLNESNAFDSAEDTCIKVAEEKSENKVENVAFWERADWNDLVDQFLEKNPMAKNYAKQISELVLKDKDVANSQNPLQSAWTKWLEQNFKTPQELLDDQQFLDAVAQNNSVKRAVIKNYMSELKDREISPPLFVPSQASRAESAGQPSLKTLEDVKELAKKFFNK